MGSRAAFETPSATGNGRPAGGLALLGPLLTEREFARRAGLTRTSVREHRCIPRIGSPIGIGAAYPAFMLDATGLRLDVAFVTLLLRRRVTDLEACDWLVRPHPQLSNLAPLHWIGIGEALEAVIDVLPPPTRSTPDSIPTTAETEAIREEWLRFRGDEETPGWTIAWDRLAGRSMPRPHGV